MSTSAGASDHAGAAVDSTSVVRVGQERLLYIGEKPFPVRSVPQCITCQCEERELVEKGIMTLRTYRAIAQSIPKSSTLWADSRSPDGLASIDLVIRRIGDHFRDGHGNSDQSVVRQVMEAVAEAQGIDIEAQGGTIVHEYGVLTEVQRRGFEDFLNSDKPVPIGVTLRATELLLRFKETAQGADGATFQRAIDQTFKILAEALGQDELAWVASKLENDPQIQEAVRAIQAQGEA